MSRRPGVEAGDSLVLFGIEKCSESDWMQVKVLLFAAHREIMGEGKIDLEVAPRATPEDVYRLLQAQQPAMAQLRPSTTFAINREIAGPSTPLSAGDELALLQPVSGGACD